MNEGRERVARRVADEAFEAMNAARAGCFVSAGCALQRAESARILLAGTAGDPPPEWLRAFSLTNAAARVVFRMEREARKPDARAIEATIRRVLEGECAARCMDSAEDREATIHALTCALTEG